MIASLASFILVIGKKEYKQQKPGKRGHIKVG